MYTILYKKHFCVFFYIILFVFLTQNSLAYTPKVGDFLFQDLNCGTLCEAITDVTYGYDKTQISHVAMIVSVAKNIEVIEASGKNVHVISLQDFLKRSIDKRGRPRVLVGRLKKELADLIPKAINYALSWKGLPYNDSFKSDNKFHTFYCSQLIYDAFMLANNNKPIFAINHMTFRRNGKTLPAWKHYFHKIHFPIPEGVVGTNPGILSRSHSLKIIYSYGELRHI